MSVGQYEQSLRSQYIEARRRLMNAPVRPIIIPPKVEAAAEKSTFDLVMENNTLRPIVLNICAGFKVRPKDVINAKRGRHNRARDELLAQLHEDTGWSLAEISRAFRANRRAVTDAVRRARPAAPSIWTNAMVKELRRLHALGIAYGDIATILGTSRNSVIGKISRLGLSQAVKFSTEFPPLSTLTTA